MVDVASRRKSVFVPLMVARISRPFTISASAISER
jgi:hypothetical protein